MPNAHEGTPHVPEQEPDLTQEGIPIVSQETFTACLQELGRLTAADQAQGEDGGTFKEKIESEVSAVRTQNPKIADYIESIIDFHNTNPEAARATLGAQLIILYKLLARQAEANTLKKQIGKI